jgi:glutathione S-transferase
MLGERHDSPPNRNATSSRHKGFSSVSDIILHHYPFSPFAEKIRRVLAWKKLAWNAVEVPDMLPKPDVMALTGGYRRTPILQLGADVYCDTALICDLLEHLQPEPALYPAHAKGIARVVAQWADTTLFTTAMAFNFGPRGAAQFYSRMAPDKVGPFTQDRSAMRGGAPRASHTDAAGAYKSYLRRIANMLETHPFLLGPQPCLADFSVYHPLWYTRTHTGDVAGVFDATPGVKDWLDRMAALPATPKAQWGAEQAIAIAASCEPAALPEQIFQDEHGIALGSRVTIASESSGTEPTEGVLMAATRMHYTLRRVDPRAGTMHLHFPRIGYTLRAVAAA